MTSQPGEKLFEPGLYQGLTSQPGEKLFEPGLYQGMTSVMPNRTHKRIGLQPLPNAQFQSMLSLEGYGHQPVH
jgi:hypothetical protein